MRHLNPLNKDPQRIRKVDKKWLMLLISRTLRFLYLKKIIKRLSKKVIFALMYCYESGLTYPVHVSE